MEFPAAPLRTFTLFVTLVLVTVPAFAASDVLDPANFDRTVAPSADFYQFAVGGWRNTHPIPADRTSWGAIDEVEQRNDLRVADILTSPEQTDAPAGSEGRKIGDFYAACTDTDGIDDRGIAALRPEFAAIAAMNGTADLAPVFARVAATAPNSPGFAFGSEPDPIAATSVIAAIGQGGLSLPTRDYYLSSDARSKTIRSAFVRYVRTAFRLLGDGAAQAARETSAVMSLETELARISRSPDALRDPFANYHPIALAQLVALAPDFRWRAYFDAARVAPAALGRIDVNQPEFVAAFGALARTAPLATWKSYLRWRDVDAASVALPKPFRAARFSFTQVVYGAKEQPPRERTCAEASDAALGFAIGKIYVAKFFPPAARERARAEIAAIRAALRDDIATVPWMSSATRAAALAKLAKLGTAKVGYPDRSRDYSQLRVSRSDFLGDVLAANRFAFARDIAKIGKPLDRSEWGLTPQTVNAYYDPSNNEIVIPAGILEPPFFDADADDAVNFGGIGVVIGHEMTHGYDDQGSDFDGDGNLHPIVSKADAARFHAQVTCIVDQLNAFRTPDGLHLSGKLDAGEATADLGGLTLAYRAMEAQFAKTGHPAPVGGFSAEQRYFLSFAQIWRENQRPEAERAQVLGDPHPIARYRVDGTLADASEFVGAFYLEPGQAMYRTPEQRCTIW
jgi:predicted metalloendopeptidase